MFLGKIILSCNLAFAGPGECDTGNCYHLLSTVISLHSFSITPPNLTKIDISLRLRRDSCGILQAF